uniref:Uncharacterized protein n=1 Tax=Setaria viridis TaxID=4556 RepID=A0A4U6TM22_SETVI|nr:hypothetical protein SEVIR_7G058501v2 [Setaria viridis]
MAEVLHFCALEDGSAGRREHRGRHARRGHPRRRVHHPEPPVPAQSNNTTSASSERTRTATPVPRLPTPTPQQEQTHCPIILRIHHPGTGMEGVGVLADTNTPRAGTGNAGFGPQVGPTANGGHQEAHPSFRLGTMAARRGEPPFFKEDGTPVSESSATKDAETPMDHGRKTAVDRRPEIRCSTWGPATLGFSTNQ